MSIVPETSSFVFPSSRARLGRKLRYVLLFCLAAAAVYATGHRALERSQPPPGFAATAAVVMKTGAPADGTPGLPQPELREVKRQVAAETNLREILAACGAEIVPRSGEPRKETMRRAIEQIRRDLEITADEDSAPGEFRFRLTYQSNNGPHSAAVVNGLAESYVRQVQRQYQDRQRRAHAEANEALARTERDVRAANQELTAYFELHLGEGVPSAAPSAESSQTSDDTPAPEGSSSGGQTDTADESSPWEPVVNPHWVRLNDELTSLERQRTQFLIDRTPDHPEVQYIEIRIVDIQQQLAVVPKWIAAEDVEEAVAQPAPQERPAPTPEPQQQIEVLQKYHALREQVDRAHQLRQQAAERERWAWRQCQTEPAIRAERGQARMVPTPPTSQNGLVFAALAAGLAMAAGAGMVSMGTAVQLPLTTVDQVEAALPVPVVGTIPASDAAVELVTGKRWQPLKRLTLITAGLLLVGGCMGALVRAWIGQ
jgi:hypothetical protein